MIIKTVEQADKIDMNWIIKSVDLEQARTNYYLVPFPVPNSRIPLQFRMPVLGTWKLDPFGELSILVEIPLDQFQPSEGDWDRVLKHPETQLYIQWQKEGHEPPPLSVVNTDKGNLRTQNRRRWLAAREAGVKSLKCWYSPTHPDRCASAKFDMRWV